MNIMNLLPTALFCAVPIVVIVVITLLFIYKAYKEAIRIGVSKKSIKKVVINSLLVSIVPTLPIIISFGIMVPILGKYIPWMRLSVIGAANYELMAADTAMKATNIAEGLTAAQIPDASFISIIWATSLGCVTSLIISAICFEKYDKILKSNKNKKSFLGVAGTCAMPAVLTTFTVPKFLGFEHPDAIIAVVSSGIFAIIFSKIAKLTKIKSINDFCFPLSMLASMLVLIIIYL